MLIISILSLTSIPILIDLIINMIEKHLNIIIYRIQWIICSLYGFIILISLPYVNPQLYNLLKKQQKHERYNRRRK